MHDIDADATTVARLYEARDALAAGLEHGSMTTDTDTGAHTIGDVVPFAPSRRRRWQVGIGVAAVAACTLAVAVLPQLVGGTATPTDTVAAASAAPMSTASYTYLREEVVMANGKKEITQIWIPKTSTGTWMYRHSFGSGKKTETVKGTCAKIRPKVACSGAGDWQDVTRAYVAQLPKETAALEAELARRAAALVAGGLSTLQPSTDTSLMTAQLEIVMVQNILESGFANADLQAQLHDVLASFPDVTVVADAKNGAGTQGTGYVVPTPDENGGVSNTSGALVFDAAGKYIGTSGSPNAADTKFTVEGKTPNGKQFTAKGEALSGYGTVFATGTASIAGGTPTLH